MRKLIHAALVVAAIAGALMVGGLPGTGKTSQEEQLAAVRTDLDVRIAEAAAGASARAATLAQLPRIGWAVATDRETVMDLTAEELGFRTHPGESIEITQVTLPDRRAHLLLRLPALPSDRPPMTQPGTQVVIEGAVLRVTAVVSIDPRRRAKELRAAVAVTITVNVGALAQRLTANGLAARLEVNGDSVFIGGVEVAPDQYSVRLPLRSAEGHPVTLLAYAPGVAQGRPIVSVALWVLALVGVAMFVVRRKGGAPLQTWSTLPAFAAQREVQNVLMDATQEDDGSDITLSGEEPSARSYRESHAQTEPRKEVSGEVVLTDSARLPGAVFEMAVVSDESSAKDARACAAVDGALVAEYSTLFREFVGLRRTCGEPTASVQEDHFIHVLVEKRAAIIAEQAVKDVTFRLAFDNGKAGVRYKAVA